MVAFLSFLGGAAEQFVKSTEKAEQDAKEMAKASFNGLYKRYEENAESNRELTNKMKAEKQFVETLWPKATPEQVNELIANPVALEAIKKVKNPQSVDLNNYIKIINGNESKAVGAERAALLPELVDRAKEGLAPAKKGGSPLKAFYGAAGEQRFTADMERYAKAQGLSLEEMQSAAKATRPAGSAQFDMSVLQEAPKSMDEIIKTAEVTRFQAGQKFGKESKEFKEADAMVKAAEAETVKADKKLEDRRDRLELQLRDSKDPAVVAAVTKEINGINADIKARREATSTKSEREGKGDDKIKYANAKTRMEDYMNTDMTMNKGLGWRKYVEEKVVKDPATGNTIVIPGKKVGLTPEQEKEYIDGMTAARMQGLKDLGLVTEKGQPINNEVKSLMTAYGLNRPAGAPAPTPAPAQPATPAAATPAAATPAAQPLTPTAQPTKVVSRATVQAQADKNKVPYATAAAEAEKQGYTIR